MAAAVAAAVDSEAGRSGVNIVLVVPVPVVVVVVVIVVVVCSTVASGPSISTSDSGAAVKENDRCHLLLSIESQMCFNKPNAALLLVFLRTVPLFSMAVEDPRSATPPTCRPERLVVDIVGGVVDLGKLFVIGEAVSFNITLTEFFFELRIATLEIILKILLTINWRQQWENRLVFTCWVEVFCLEGPSMHHRPSYHLKRPIGSETNVKMS